MDTRHIGVDGVLAIMDVLAIGRNRAMHTQTNPQICNYHGQKSCELSALHAELDTSGGRRKMT